MNSSNGTYFNGQPLVDERPLTDGDRLTIGETELVFGVDQVRSTALPEDSPSATVRVELALRPCIRCGVDLALGTQVCPRCRQDQQQPVEPAEPAEAPPAPTEDQADAPPAVADSSPQVAAPAPPPVPTPVAAPPPPPPRPTPEPATPDPVAPPLVAAPPPVAEIELDPAPVAASAPLVARPGVTDSNPEFAPPAGFWIRLLGWVVDAVWINLTLILVGLLLPGSVQSVVGGILGLALGLGVPIIGWGRYGTTPGKRLFKLYVCTVEGEVGIGYGRAALRLVGYVCSGLLLCIGFLMIGLTPAKRGLHDHLAGTYVARR